MEGMTIQRLPKREDPQMVPQPVSGEPGLYRVDATWGTIQPMHAADGVVTVGEREVIRHLERGLPVVDARSRAEYEAGTIPGARSLPHDDVAERSAELDRRQQTVFFCNGPQCGQSPDAIRTLLDAGYPPSGILYYRGGVHDWLTLGLPLTAPG